MDPDSNPGTVYDVEWVPGGCVLHARQNLVVENFYPHSGKAYCEDLYQSQRLSERGVSMRIAADAIAWIDDPRTERMPFAVWLRDLKADYRVRRHYVEETARSRWRMHAYYAVRILSRIGKLLQPAKQSRSA